MSVSNNTNDLANYYHSKAWLTLPLEPKSKIPPKGLPWKERTFDDVNIASDFNDSRNIGVILGEKSSGLVDIDLDCPEALAIADICLPETGLIFGRASTPQSHWIYLVEECGGTKQFQSSGTIVEYRANGGYTVFPPSIHETGEQYAFHIQGEPARIEKAVLMKAVSELAAAAMLAQEWKEGIRHNASLALAGGLLNAGWAKDDIEFFMTAVCMAANDTQTTNHIKSVETTIEGRYQGKNMWGFPKLAELMDKQIVARLLNFLGINSNTVVVRATSQQILLPGEGYEYTDVHNAESFAPKYDNILRYNHARKHWCVYDGKRWKRDDEGRAKLLGIRHIKNLQYATIEAVHAGQAGKHALAKLFRRRAIEDMLNLAQPSMGISDDVFDTDLMRLNCQNGTVNLPDGSIAKHRPDDFISRITPVEYDEKAECPTWHKFLTHVMSGNKNLLAFLQRAVGYSLTGRADEQCFFIMIGSGANGKSTFMGTITKLMGEYAANTPMETLTVQKNSSIPNDVARLKNIRFVTAIEGEHTHKLAEAKIKAMTGGEKVTARFLHGEFFEYLPQFKIWMATNELPKITGTDVGIWRRIHVIPFNVKITDAEKDLDLPNKLAAELPGILNWALEGCFEWQYTGLNPPPEVKAATDGYQNDMDIIAQFIEDCCEKEAGAFTKKIDLFRRFENWCSDNGEATLTKNDFGRKLKGKGIRDDKLRGSRGWLGIKLPQLVAGGVAYMPAAPVPMSGQMDELDTVF